MKLKLFVLACIALCGCAPQTPRPPQTQIPISDARFEKWNGKTVQGIQAINNGRGIVITFNEGPALILTCYKYSMKVESP
jgi:hypothetical protein